jgi:hypothetical protein
VAFWATMALIRAVVSMPVVMPLMELREEVAIAHLEFHASRKV